MRRTAAGAALVGVGLMAAVDEIVFHQLLHWHHFYDRATSSVALLSDGLLHAGEVVALVGGIFLLADQRRRGLLSRPAGAGWLFVGAGGFQVFDGVVDHKLLRVHQIRYGVPSIVPYDVLWNLGGLVLVLIGLALLLSRRAVPGREEGNGEQ